ncbi:hypothetical protein DFA_05895 [Cavenderia fasciculata]|uniref:Ubiquitin-like domain-containing protein n=1 Tax=Cavenderia fasciculata TaxID=261658 RepID=F4PJI6_CACFS|nr:uncharacterized protein DFA_05895 [Cavenderia fasciculata]EGG23760.1 hypothetical protein DFA_05895 [Cavenderia fasciculata]|eukprot:XP_004361611.1 hypothetical protein DFA_05895 [Cavenderia fasciculata]
MNLYSYIFRGPSIESVRGKLEDVDQKRLSNIFFDSHPESEDDIAPLLVKEYLKFITLKVLDQDWDATKLSPSPLIDQMWHIHILETKSYQDMCNKFGRMIHHRASIKEQEDDDPLLQQEKRNRYRRTLELYEKYYHTFQDNTSTIWDTQYLNIENHHPLPILTKIEYDPDVTVEAPAPDKLESRIMLLTVRLPKGTKVYLWAKEPSTTTIGRVTDVALGYTGYDYRIIYRGKQIEPDMLLSELRYCDFENGDTFDIVFRLRGC